MTYPAFNLVIQINLFTIVN